jgi:hypothetical protein
MIATPNGAQFEVLVYESAISEGFWQVPVSEVAFEEQEYNKETGVHTIRVDHENIDESYILSVIEDHGATVVSQNPTRSVLDIHRDVLLLSFQQAVKLEVERAFQRRQFCFEKSELDVALANDDPASPDYGTVTLTRQQAALLIHNRLND